MDAEQVATAVVQTAGAAGAAGGGIGGAVSAAVAGVGGLVAAATVLRRRLSRDATEMTKDRAESRFVEVLLRERDEAIAEAREAMRARQANVEDIARLTAENAHQEREIARLTTEFAALKKMLMRVVPETRRYLSSTFDPLHDIPKQ